jgi:hypothetical protein
MSNLSKTLSNLSDFSVNAKMEECINDLENFHNQKTKVLEKLRLPMQN